MNQMNVAMHQRRERLLGLVLGEARQQLGIGALVHSMVICAPKENGDKVLPFISICPDGNTSENAVAIAS